MSEGLGLRPGDVVGVAFPAGPAHPTQQEQGMAVLESLGYRPRAAAGAGEPRGYLAGDDDQRADGLNGLIADPDVRGILFARGGYGTARILDRIDLDGLRRDPRLLVGFSDLTVLFQALQRDGDYPLGYGPNLADLARPDLYDADSFRTFLAQGPAAARIDLRGCRVLAPGCGRGVLRGGCLTLLQSMIGTPWEPDYDGTLLFWEDWNEEPYRVDRMLNQLRTAGRLQGIRGMIVGEPVGLDPLPGKPSLTLQQVLLDHVAPLGVPVVVGLRAGHCAGKITLPLGMPATLDADGGALEIS